MLCTLMTRFIYVFMNIISNLVLIFHVKMSADIAKTDEDPVTMHIDNKTDFVYHNSVSPKC